MTCEGHGAGRKVQEGGKGPGGDKCSQWNTVLGTLRSQADFSEVEISVSILKILPGLDMEERASKSDTCVMCKTADSHAEQGQNSKACLKEGRAVNPSF